MNSNSTQALIAFGANVGDPQTTYELVQQELQSICEAVSASQPIETQPVSREPQQNQSNYVNAAIRVETELAASDLFDELLHIEEKFGRIRNEKWGPRTIDLDLILYGDQVIRSDKLTCPHPRMSFRKFVLEPAAEVAADMLDPVSGCQIKELWIRIQNRPRLIVWVDDDFSSLPQQFETPAGHQGLVVSSEKWKEASSTDFAICPTSSVGQFEELCHQCRLVICNGTPTNEMGIAIGNFVGSKLVCNLDSRLLLAEMMGAIDAMS